MAGQAGQDDRDLAYALTADRKDLSGVLGAGCAWVTASGGSMADGSGLVPSVVPQGKRAYKRMPARGYLRSSSGCQGAAVGEAFRVNTDDMGPAVSSLNDSAANLKGVYEQAAAQLPGPRDTPGDPGKDPVATEASKNLLPGPGSC